MRSMVRVLAVSVLLFGVTASAIAKTPREQLEAALKKQAADLSGGEKGRATCVCLDGSSLNFRAGWLIRLTVSPSNGFAVRCVVQGFDSAGGVTGASATCALFAVLPK